MDKVLNFRLDHEANAKKGVEEPLETCTMLLERRGGRACETCALNLENKVRKLPGVRKASASYISGVLSVAYDGQITTPEQIITHVMQMGAAVVPVEEQLAAKPGQPRRAKPASALSQWLQKGRVEMWFMIWTFVFMLAGLGFEKLTTLHLMANVFYALAYVTGGAYGLKAGLESLRQWTIDIDLLMIIAALGAAVVGAPFEGAVLLFLFSLSNVLQSYALDRTRNALRALMELRPTEALTRRGGRIVRLPIDQIVIGDRIIVRPGERIPLDGIVVEGESAVDQSSITGESIPVSKQVGDQVLAGTINQLGGLEIRVSKRAKDSTIARLIKLVEEAQSQKARTQRFIDKAEQYYALGVIVFSSLSIPVAMLWLGEAFAPAFYRAMSLIVAASPCALVISTPATVLSAIANGARQGVLFKGGVHLERAASIKVIAFDKTGTLTEGKPQVTDILPARNASANQVLALAAAVEAKSEHPLAQAIVNAAQTRGLAVAEASGFQSTTGKGVRANVEGQQIHIGNLRYFEQYPHIPLGEFAARVIDFETRGKTCVLVARDDGARGEVLGLIAIADVLRENVVHIIRELKNQGIERVIMLTGDNQRVAENIADQAAVDEFYAGLLPEDKLRIIQQIERKYGPVAMVGDGVNDAPALATASLGIAMGAAGTDVALETADIVLMGDDLTKIAYTIALSRQTRKRLIQNLAFAMGVIVVLIVSVLGFQLALPLSVVGHEGSTVLVSLNGLRMLRFRKEQQ